MHNGVDQTLLSSELASRSGSQAKILMGVGKEILDKSKLSEISSKLSIVKMRPSELGMIKSNFEPLNKRDLSYNGPKSSMNNKTPDLLQKIVLAESNRETPQRSKSSAESK